MHLSRRLVLIFSYSAFHGDFGILFFLLLRSMIYRNMIHGQHYYKEQKRNFIAKIKWLSSASVCVHWHSPLSSFLNRIWMLHKCGQWPHLLSSPQRWILRIFHHLVDNSVSFLYLIYLHCWYILTYPGALTILLKSSFCYFQNFVFHILSLINLVNKPLALLSRMTLSSWYSSLLVFLTAL